MVPHAAFTGFTQLSGNVWYQERKEKTLINGETTRRGPDLIILSTWMGASPRHIAKYIVGYQTLFPTSDLLVITNGVPDVSWRPERAQRKRLAPLMPFIERAKGSHIMLSIFSNGGVNQANTLAKMYQRAHGRPLPIQSMVLDSCPGRANYWTGLAAFTVGLPRFWPLRIFLLCLIHLLLISFWISNRVVPRRNFLVGLRTSLNDPLLFPVDCPRMYIYSKADEMVIWTDVAAHAAEAHKKGWSVDEEVFEQSKHVGHLMMDKERYWDAVRSVV